MMRLVGLEESLGKVVRRVKRGENMDKVLRPGFTE
jgi:hypothetical protein